MRKPVLIVIAGPNGSGKASITKRILHHEWMEDSIYINPDEVAQEKFGNWNSREAIMQTVKYCEELRKKMMSKRNFCLDSKRVILRRNIYKKFRNGQFLYCN